MQAFQRFGIVVLLWVVAMLWQGGCGPNGDCNSDSECTTGFNCQLVEGTKRCIRPACVPACVAGQECILSRCIQTESAPQDGGNNETSSETPTEQPCQGLGCACQKDADCQTNQRCASGFCILRATEGANETPTAEAGPDEPITETTPTEETTLTEEQPNSETSAEKIPEDPIRETLSEQEPTQEKSTPETISETPDNTDSSTNPDTNACQKDSECKAGYLCQQGTCVLAPPVVCNPSCAATQQCTPSGCVSETTAGIGEECSAQKPCAQGLGCVQVSSSVSRCFQPCQGPQDCQQNTLRKACYFLGGSQSYCIQEAGNGQSCGLSGKIQALCNSATVCQESLCQVPATVAPNARCGIQGKICPQDHPCIGFPDGNGGFIRYCMKSCTYKSNDPKSDCPNLFTCEELSGTRGFCTPDGTAQADDLCGGTQSGNTFDSSKACAPGLSCVGLARSICLPLADGDCTSSGLQCASGRQCSVIYGGGKSYSICSQVCSASNTCNKSYLGCDTSRKLCFPNNP